MDVVAEVSGSVWKVLVERGSNVENGQTIVILESMKMEIPVEAPGEGLVAEVRVAEGESVVDGDVMVVLH